MKNKKIFFSLIISILFIFSMLSSKSLAWGPTSEPTIQGIDVSAYQGDIDFAEVKNAGIEIVYMKSSQGFSYVDSTFESNFQKAKQNGLKVGVYHFLTARTNEEAEKQAQFFVSLVGNKEIDCKLAMDFEVFGDLSNEEINSIGLTFLREVERLSNKKAIIYSDAFNARTLWCGEILEFPLWIAEYDVEQPEDVIRWESWTGWQYTDEGNVNGISTFVDRDFYTKEVFLDDNSSIKPIKPPDNKPVLDTISIIIKRGDTLSELALKYNTTVVELVNLNNIQNPNLIFAGNTLIVPVEKQQENQSVEYYIVKPGDTLNKLALRFGTSVNQIARDNGIRNVNLIFVGQRLLIRTNVLNDLGSTTYTVRPGDTLWGIARRYNTSIANIVRMNRIQNPNLIFPGEIFRI